MAFNADRFTRQTLAFNSGLVVLEDSSNENGPALFTYASASDNLATVEAANYFAPVVYDLSVGDVLIVNASDGSNMEVVSAVNRSAGTITISTFTPAGSVGTSNIINLAVTTGKIAANAVTSAKLATNIVQYATVALTAAQFNGMYATPVQLVAAGGANTLLVLDKLDLLMTYRAAAFAAGGVAAVQYDSTANGAGVLASTTWAAAAFQAAASTGFPFLQSSSVPQTFSTCVNKGLYISNLTGAFTTGDSTFVAHVWYKIIATV